jgi:hypothetical protein
VIPDDTALYLGAAVLGWAIACYCGAELLSGWWEKRQAHRRELMERERWIADYEARQQKRRRA